MNHSHTNGSFNRRAKSDFLTDIYHLFRIKDTQQRLSGSRDVHYNGPFKYAVLLRHRTIHGGYTICGGSIISEHWILTAASCVSERDPRLYEVRAGAINDHEWGKREFRVVEVRPHEEFHYLGNGIQTEHDIALVRVAQPFTFDHVIGKADLLDEFEELRSGITGTVVGWGVNQRGEFPKQLQAVELPVLDRETCIGLYLQRYGQLPKGQFCAGYLLDKLNGHKNVCDGDNGGPFTVHGKLAGIVSWVGRPCGRANSPAVFTEVGKYRSWILGHTGIYL